MLESIVKNEPPLQETLYDQPLIDNDRARVTGPFTVEAVPAPTVKPLSAIESEPASDASIVRSGETLRQSQWREELLQTGIRARGGSLIKFSRVEPLPGTRYLHADAESLPSPAGEGPGVRAKPKERSSLLVPPLPL
jgi:adenine-specific DNA-methyltransferase